MAHILYTLLLVVWGCGSVSRDVKVVSDGLLFGRTKLQRPISGEITSYFGNRGTTFHHGVDIRSNHGTVIKAALPGTVTYVGNLRGYGQTIIVGYENETTIYAHCSEVLVQIGDKVVYGEKLALVGQSGNARGYHLHFEYRIGGKPVDPMLYF